MNTYIIELKYVKEEFGDDVNKMNISDFHRFILTHELPLMYWDEAFRQIVDYYSLNS